jgi:hypothetical protein
MPSFKPCSTTKPPALPSPLDRGASQWKPPRRSTPRPGKPVTWGRATAVGCRRGCDAERCAAEWVVPVFTAVHSIEEEPDSAPAASPCSNRVRDRVLPSGQLPTAGYAADLQHGLLELGLHQPREVPQPCRLGMRHSRPRSARFEPSSVERLYNTSSSRTPLDPCSSGPRHLAVLTHPGFVGAAPTLADTSRLRLPPASAGCCDSPQVQVFHLHSNSSASRRTKPALNAFAVTFEGRIPTR